MAELEGKMLEAKVRLLGEGHEESLALMQKLVKTYEKSGKVQEAEEMRVRLSGARKSLGSEGTSS